MLFDLFSDIFTFEKNAITRMDPRVKIIVAGVAVTLVLVSDSIFFPTAVFIMCLVGAVIAKAPVRLILLRFTAPMGMAAMILVLKTFLVPGAPIFTFTFMGWELTAGLEGFDEGIIVASRVLGALGVLQLTSFVTPAHQIFRSLSWFGFPHGWVEVAMMMYRYIFDLFEIASDVGSAQKARLGYSSVNRAISSIGDLAGGVIVRSVDKAVRTHEAMIVRGYKNAIHFDPMARPGINEIMTTLLGSGALAGLWYGLGLI